MDGMLSQEEINALLGEMSVTGSDTSTSENDGQVELLTDEEKDAVGEISNISMGTAATTLSMLVNNVVNITTPQISYSTIEEVASSYEKPCVFIHISYKEGLDGSNVLLLKDEDVKIITDLMMGNDGTDVNSELSDMHLSAIGEAMNQMMGSSSTSLSSMLNKKIDISTPVAEQYSVDLASLSEEMRVLSNETLVKVSFKMEIGTLVNSEIMQMFPVSFAREMYESLKEVTAGETSTADNTNISGSDSQSSTSSQNASLEPAVSQNAEVQPFNGGYQQQQQQPNVQPVAFQNFAPVANNFIQPENMDLIMDVPLEVTVELGRANKSIKEILEFSPGTIIELNKLAGEPVDVLVNGKLVAKGEVVVIEESFGIRITEIIKNV
ncbi:MAG: flagellar motor switch phosphatase FliY [Lachnospiraceae bacterium]|nr:flagellar motor switch phosphatase FliY [Lachnospiraceae bacterium]